MKLFNCLRGLFKTEVGIRFVTEHGRIPVFSTEGAAGADLYAGETVRIPSGKSALIGTGIALELPKCSEAQIRSRSGLAAKNRVFVLNSPATIDEDYKGEVKVILMNLGDEEFVVHNGDRIAQMVIKRTLPIKFLRTYKITKTKRGTGGFGSTGV